MLIVATDELCAEASIAACHIAARAARQRSPRQAVSHVDVAPSAAARSLQAADCARASAIVSTGPRSCSAPALQAVPMKRLGSQYTLPLRKTLSSGPEVHDRRCTGGAPADGASSPPICSA